MKHWIIALAAVLVALSSCTRENGEEGKSTSETKIDHLIIKEVFYIGHYWLRDVSKWGMANTYRAYNDDQYITIYNPTDKVLYLDSLAIVQNAIDPTKVIEFAPQDNFVDKYYGAGGILYFPGAGTDHPVKPGQTIVVAKYAIDHSKNFEKQLEGEDLKDYQGIDQFLDLTKADYEWTNSATSSINNPNVPDLLPIADNNGFHSLAEATGLALIRLPWSPETFKANSKAEKGKDGIVHYISVTNNAFADFYAIEIPFKNVIDCMTICPKKRFQMRPSKLDKGYNGVADEELSHTKSDLYPKVTGKALIRKWDGKKFVDTDNSTTDFEVQEPTLARPATKPTEK